MQVMRHPKVSGQHPSLDPKPSHTWLTLDPYPCPAAGPGAHDPQAAGGADGLHRPQAPAALLRRRPLRRPGARVWSLTPAALQTSKQRLELVPDHPASQFSIQAGQFVAAPLEAHASEEGDGHVSACSSYCTVIHHESCVGHSKTWSLANHRPGRASFRVPTCRQTMNPRPSCCRSYTPPRRCWTRTRTSWSRSTRRSSDTPARLSSGDASCGLPCFQRREHPAS
jgi:hypothetical protein